MTKASLKKLKNDRKMNNIAKLDDAEIERLQRLVRGIVGAHSAYVEPTTLENRYANLMNAIELLSPQNAAGITVYYPQISSRANFVRGMQRQANLLAYAKKRRNAKPASPSRSYRSAHSESNIESTGSAPSPKKRPSAVHAACSKAKEFQKALKSFMNATKDGMYVQRKEAREKWETLVALSSAIVKTGGKYVGAKIMKVARAISKMGKTGVLAFKSLLYSNPHFRHIVISIITSAIWHICTGWGRVASGGGTVLGTGFASGVDQYTR